jgi:hypothetical protein
MVTRSRNSKIQYNGKKTKCKRSNNDIQNIIQKTTDPRNANPTNVPPNIHCNATCMTSFKDGDILEILIDLICGDGKLLCEQR